MLVKIFVGNLPWSVGDADLEDIFAPHGDVKSAQVVTDRDTGRSRGFGFVEIETDNAQLVISDADGYDFNGRNLRVNLAEDKPSGGNSPFGGDRGDFGGGGRRDRY